MTLKLVLKFKQTLNVTFEVNIIDGKWYRTPDEGCPFVWVRLRSVCGTINKVDNSGLFSTKYFYGLPEGLEYTVSVWKSGWKSYRGLNK